MSQDPTRFEAPLDFSSLKEIHKGANGTFIIHIQDAHSNLSGQENLANTLDEIMKRYGVSLVLVEGGSINGTLTPLKKIAAPEITKRVARSLLIEGKIAGEEYLNLVSDRPMKIMGIENMNLYLKSVQSYAGLADKREAILNYLKFIQKAIEKLKNKFYPQELLIYEKMKEGYGASYEANFRELLKLVELEQIDLRDFPEIQKLQALQNKEKTIDFNLANLEQVSLVEEIQKRGGAKDLKIYLGKMGEMKNQKVSQFTCFQKFFKIAKEKNISFERYPNLIKYGKYLKDFSNLDLEKVLEELERLEDKVYVSLLPVDDQRIVRSIDRYITLLVTAYRIQMSTKEFDFFEANEPDFSTVSYLAFINRKLADFGYFDCVIPYKKFLEEGKKSLEDFYSLVGQRDIAFIENTERLLKQENQKVVVLISGGYHTPHLKKIFNENGYSFAVLTPLVTQETNQQKYEKLLLSTIKHETKKIETAYDEDKNDILREVKKVEGVRYTQAASRLADVLDPLASAARLPTDDPQLKNVIEEFRVQIEAGARLAVDISPLGKDEIAVTGPTLVEIFIGQIGTLQQKIQSKLPNLLSYKRNTFKLGGVIYQKKKAMGQGGRVRWAFKKNDKIKVAKYFGLKFRRSTPVLEKNQVAVSSEGLRKVFVGNHAALAVKLKALLPPLDFEKDTIVAIGVTFERRMSGPKQVWSFRKKDINKIAEMFGLKIKQDIPKLEKERIAISGRELRKIFVGTPQNLYEKMSTALPLVTFKKNRVLIRGVVYEKRLTHGGNILWSFNEKDRFKIAKQFNFKLKQNVSKPSTDDVIVSQLGLTNFFIGDTSPMAKAINDRLPPTTSLKNQVTVGGVIYEKRLTGGGKILWSFKKSDKKKVAQNFSFQLRNDGEDTWERIEALNLTDVIALLGNDPLRLQQYLRVYHPEISMEEIDRIAVASLNGLGGDGIEKELHVDYKKTLISTDIKQDVKSTKGHSFNLTGKVGAETDYVQVSGAYTRRIAVRQDGTFSASIPLPKKGEINEFEVYCFNPDTEEKSEPTLIQVRQTGQKENTEEAFLRLLALKEEVLREIHRDPKRHQFLLRATELTLLKHFTYNEKQGIDYLKRRIKAEASSTLKTILKIILKKFQTIRKMDFNLKPGERLYFFQKYTIYETLSLMEKGSTGIILANEQGMGKTVTALAAINGKEAVILTPNSVVSTWGEQEEQFFPTPKLEILEGTYAEREEALAHLERPQVVTNIEFTRGINEHRAQLLSRPKGILVVDEGDYLGSKTSQQSQGTRDLQAQFRLVLTATPFKRISQIGHLLSFIFPNDPRFKSTKAFARAFPPENREALNALFLLMQEHTIRIRKQDVFESYDTGVPLEKQSDRLPKKVEISPEQEGQFVLTEEQSKSIRELFTDYQRWSSKHRGHESFEDRQFYRFKEGYFSKKEALRQIMNDPAYISKPGIESPKHKAMDRLVKKELGADTSRKMLIFVRYRAEVKEYLRRYAPYGAHSYYGGLQANANGYRIDAEGRVLYYKTDEYKNFILEGSEFVPSDKDHGRPIRALDYERILFQNSPSSRIMVATYDTGALGVTFTAADTVVFDDLAPTYRDQYQAADRAHRIDNKRKKYEVKYYWLQALYPDSFLRDLPKDIFRDYFEMGTYDQVHYQNLKKQGRIFHRVMDGVGSEEELTRANQQLIRERMPFLFSKGETESENAEAKGARLAVEDFKEATIRTTYKVVGFPGLAATNKKEVKPILDLLALIAANNQGVVPVGVSGDIFAGLSILPEKKGAITIRLINPRAPGKVFDTIEFTKDEIRQAGARLVATESLEAKLPKILAEDQLAVGAVRDYKTQDMLSKRFLAQMAKGLKEEKFVMFSIGIHGQDAPEMMKQIVELQKELRELKSEASRLSVYFELVDENGNRIESFAGFQSQIPPTDLRGQKLERIYSGVLTNALVDQAKIAKAGLLATQEARIDRNAYNVIPYKPDMRTGIMTAIADIHDENVRHMLQTLMQINIGIQEVQLVKEVPDYATAETYRQKQLIVKALATLSQKLYEAYVTLRAEATSA